MTPFAGRRQTTWSQREDHGSDTGPWWHLPLQLEGGHFRPHTGLPRGRLGVTSISATRPVPGPTTAGGGSRR